MTAVSESIMREKLKVGSKSNTRTPFAFSTLTIFFQVDVTFFLSYRMLVLQNHLVLRIGAFHPSNYLPRIIEAPTAF